MMKVFMLWAALGVYPVCGEQETLFEWIKSVLEEVPVAEDIVEGDTSQKIVLTWNAGTGGWSLVRVWATGSACIIRTGYGYEKEM